MTTTLEHPVKQKPFPRLCFNCGKHEVFLAVVPYSREFKYEDKLYSVDLPTLESPRCRACGELSFGVNVDIQVVTAERKVLRLLSGTQIRAGRERLGMTPADLANLLGVSETALTKWEDDFSLQPRTADNLLRVFFAFPEARAALNGQQHAGLGVLAG
jgi:DNA-binding transcriptional regulator YiaG